MVTTKQRSSTSSPQPSAQPAFKRLKKVICPICSEAIEDVSAKKKGHDAIFCDGDCQDWLHRHCSGLSKARFQSI